MSYCTDLIAVPFPLPDALATEAKAIQEAIDALRVAWPDHSAAGGDGGRSITADYSAEMAVELLKREIAIHVRIATWLGAASAEHQAAVDAAAAELVEAGKTVRTKLANIGHLVEEDDEQAVAGHPLHVTAKAKHVAYSDFTLAGAKRVNDEAKHRCSAQLAALGEAVA